MEVDGGVLMIDRSWGGGADLFGSLCRVGRDGECVFTEGRYKGAFFMRQR